MDTKKFRDRFNMSQNDFSRFFGIPLRTVQNWDYRHCCPDYLIDILYRFMDLIGGAWHDEKTDT